MLPTAEVCVDIEMSNILGNTTFHLLMVILQLFEYTQAWLNWM